MNSIIKVITCIALIAFTLSSCDKNEEEIVYGDLGEITVTVEGDQSVVPAILTFTAEAENAVFYIWDFDYKKDLNEADDDDTMLPMGNIGDEVELTFQHGGTYTVKVTAYNGNYKTKTKEITINLYSFEDDLTVNTTEEIELDIDRDVCDPDNSLSFNLEFDVTDAHSILDKLYVVRSYSSAILGDYTVADTLVSTSINYTYATQAELLESFGITAGTEVNDEDALTYILYGVGNNGYTEMLDEVTVTASVNLIEAVTIPLGDWEARNDDTDFTKTVQIHRPSPFRTTDDGRYWITDFGLDWSNWHDYWYTIEFKLLCPVEGDPRYIIDLFGAGLDTGQEQTDIDHTGTEVTKDIRIMPYIYSGSAVGYYDPDAQVISFVNVPLTDAWWGADNHTVNLTFTYLGK